MSGRELSWLPAPLYMEHTVQHNHAFIIAIISIRTVIATTAAKDLCQDPWIAYDDGYHGLVNTPSRTEQHRERLFAQGHTKQRIGIG